MKYVLTLLAIAASTGSALADSVDVSFSRISSNASENVESQFGLTIQEVVGDSSVVDFVFTNAVGIQSSISEIYLDNGQPQGEQLAGGSIIEQVGTDFNWGSASPGNLPGGESLADPFVVSFALLGDAQGNPSKGINTATDRLTVRFAYTAGTAYADLLTALGNGGLRIGFHVRGIGDEEDSDSFVSEPMTMVPMPSVAGMACLGLAGIATGRRRR